MIRGTLAATSGVLAIAFILIASTERLVAHVEPSQVRLHVSYSIPTPKPPPFPPELDAERGPFVVFEGSLVDVRWIDYIGRAVSVALSDEENAIWQDDWCRVILIRCSLVLIVLVGLAALLLFVVARRQRGVSRIVRAMATVTGAAASVLLALWLSAVGSDSAFILAQSGMLGYTRWETLDPPRNVEFGSRQFDLGPIEYERFVEIRGISNPKRLQRTHIEADLLPIAAIFLVYPVGLLLSGPLRGRRRRKRGLCVACGYNLAGLTERRCPECNTRFGPTEEEQSE